MPRLGPLCRNVAKFNFNTFAGDKCWVAGVELATANAPPSRKPQIWGRRPSADDPSHPRRSNLLLNLANFFAILKPDFFG